MTLNLHDIESTYKKTLVSLFEESVVSHPNNIALKFGNSQETYDSLNRKANAVASALIKIGARDNELVGILMSKSINSIITMIGIMKAGCAYLPIDTTYPKSRQSLMIEHSKCRIIVGDSFNTPSDEQCIVYTFEELLKYSSGKSNHSKAQSGDAAYVIYTSGSTGIPKGVTIEHKSIVNTVMWRVGFYRFDESDVILQIPSHSFDSSVIDIFCALSAGSKLVLISDKDKLNLDALATHIECNRISHMLVTPTFYKVILHSISSRLQNLSSVTIAGEMLTNEIVQLHHEVLPLVQLVNEYGPTENSVCSSAHIQGRGEIRVGAPIAGTVAMIVNESLKQVEPGCSGELLLAGSGLARGYHNDLEQTKQKFIHLNGLRYYRTGDFASIDDNGSIKIIGRIDDQVKIRGFRVELSEIESCLLSHENIVDTKVISMTNNGRVSLFGFMILNDQYTKETSVLEHLKDKLPEYMIPSKLCVVGAFPTLPNGKLDTISLKEIANSINADTKEILTEDSNDLINTLSLHISNFTNINFVQLTRNTNADLKSLGVDSINLLTLLIDLQQKYKIEFDFTKLSEMCVISVESLAEEIKALLIEASKRAIA